MGTIRLLFRLREFYYKTFLSPATYAVKLGVKIGNNCFIATRNWSNEPYLITIGNNVQVTKDVYFHTHGGGHVARYLYPDFDVFGKIEVKDGAYIGSGSHIMPGVTIGEGSLVAAGSIVTKSIPKMEVWGGNPARRICSVEEYIQKNLKYNLNTKRFSPRQKKKILCNANVQSFINK